MKGNAKFHTKIIELYNPDMYKVARYYLNSAYNKIADVEDAVQEVWIKVFKYIDLLEEAEKFPSWISKIMKNQCLNMQKKNISITNKHMFVDIESRNDIVNIIEDGDLSNITHESRQALKKFMGMLPNKYSEPLEMFYFQKMKIKNIAEYLDLNLSALKWRMQRGRELLRIKFKELNKKQGE
ncbi:MAG: sigma-70 family RNA polymerase sigma factor [Candidatus Delongbacteria bacterium]|nr:sigma-70 family RNA polymerase sigma factor [Candidatus Delongbacteria bacterium]